MISGLLDMMPPLLGEFIVPFLILGLAIALITGGLKKDDPAGILAEGGRLFLILTVGFALFVVALFILGDPHMMF